MSSHEQPAAKQEITFEFIRECIAKIDPSHHKETWAWIYSEVILVEMRAIGIQRKLSLEEVKRVHSYIDIARGEIYGSYCIVDMHGVIRSETYIGLEAATLAAENIGGRHLLLATTGDYSCYPVIAARYLEFFGGNEFSVRTALTRLFAITERNELNDSAHVDYIIREARWRLANQKSH